MEKVSSVIVVDDSTVKEDLDGFDEIVLTHVRIPERIFISRAKNIGWKLSSTELVFFIDDDNVVGDETLGPVLDAVQSSGDIGAAMPAVLYKSQPDLVWVYAEPFLNRRLKLNLLGRNKPRNPVLEKRFLSTDDLPNASLVRRRAIEEVGGFDERLVANCGLDFTQRLKSRGWRTVSCTGAMILHDVEAPGRIGWWAIHGAVDPDIVKYQISDWFIIMQRLHGQTRLLFLRSSVGSLRFVLPNIVAYLARGESRLLLMKNVLLGYISGYQVTR